VIYFGSQATAATKMISSSAASSSKVHLIKGSFHFPYYPLKMYNLLFDVSNTDSFTEYYRTTMWNRRK
jgi:hypothetical protein